VVDVEELERLVRQGWPALEEIEVDGWVARFAEGVTQRANSVSPVGEPGDPHAAVERVERLYRERGLPATFQVGPVVRPGDLDGLLAERGYRLGSPTEVWTAEVAAVTERASRSAEVRVSDAPDGDWLDLWWSVDGRGDHRALAVAAKILSAGPARYASVRDDAGVAAVGRLAVVGDWGGLYCVAVRPDARRRGLGTAVLRGVLEQSEVNRCWLQVRADNHGARAMYARLGFTAAARYHYRTRPN
jgi:ribosomal protein S18 acetylase RimI-like enzyme